MVIENVKLMHECFPNTWHVSNKNERQRNRRRRQAEKSKNGKVVAMAYHPSQGNYSELNYYLMVLNLFTQQQSYSKYNFCKP